MFFVYIQIDSSKQRTRLRKKIASERTQLNTLIDKYNVLIASDGGIPLTIDSVLTGDTPNDIDQSDGKWFSCDLFRLKMYFMLLSNFY